MGAESTRVHCIADDSAWLDSVRNLATSPVRCVTWAEFNSAPMDFANPEVIALARFSEFSAEIDQQLGRLCRSFPNGVLVELARGLPLLDEQFFAHGFQKLNSLGKKSSNSLLEQNLSNHLSAQSSASGERCFEYCLSNYKAVPHWLNSRFWAHPERFHL